MKEKQEDSGIRYVYTITNLINGKQYVGVTKNFKKRFKDHKAEMRGKTNKPLYNSMRKYGIENFKFEIICTCDLSNIEEKEKYFIKELKTFHPNGYNMTSGGEYRKELSIESIEKIASKNRGRKHTGKALENIRNGWKNKPPMTDETKRKLSESNTGKKRTTEQNEKNRLAQLGKIQSVETVNKRLNTIKERFPNGITFIATPEQKLANRLRNIELTGDKHIYTFIHIDNTEFTGYIYEFRDNFNLNKNSIYKLSKGISYTYKGWKIKEIFSLNDSLEENEKTKSIWNKIVKMSMPIKRTVEQLNKRKSIDIDYNIYSFQNNHFDNIIGNRYECIEKLKIENKSSISSLFHGSLKSYKGWSLIHTEYIENPYKKKKE